MIFIYLKLLLYKFIYINFEKMNGIVLSCVISFMLEEIEASAKKWSTAKNFSHLLQFMNNTKVLIDQYIYFKKISNA